MNIRSHLIVLCCFVTGGIFLMAACERERSETGKIPAQPTLTPTSTLTPTPPPRTTTQPTRSTRATPTPILSGDALVATTRYGPLTLADIGQYAANVQIPQFKGFRAHQINQVSPDKLRGAVQWIGARQVAERELYASGDREMIEKCERQFREAREEMLIRHLYHQHVSKAVGPIPEQQIADYYENHTQRFKEPFNFSFRRLILLTYERTEAKPGETLEDIARRVNGDPEVADQIRAATPSRPLRREAGEMFKPLRPGEPLLVPMAEQDAQNVRKRLEELLAKLDQGVTFEQLCNEYSEWPHRGQVFKNFPRGTRPVISSIVQAGKQTPVGQLSPIYRSKHGYEVIQVVDKQEGGVPPLDKVRELIEEELLRQQRSEKTEQMLDMLFDNPEFEIEYDKFARGDHLSTDSVVATVGDHKIPWEEVRKLWDSHNRPTQPEAIENLLRRSKPVQAALAEDMLSEQINDPDSQLHRAISYARTGFVGNSFLHYKAVERTNELIDDDLRRKFYEDYKERFKQPMRLAFTSMLMQLDENTAQAEEAVRKEALATLEQQMSRRLQSIESAEEFRDTAMQLNEVFRGTSVRVPRNSKPIQLNSIPEPIRTRIADLEPGEWTAPYPLNAFTIASSMVTERIPEQIPPLKQVSRQINEKLFERHFPRIKLELESEYADQSEINFHL